MRTGPSYPLLKALCRAVAVALLPAVMLVGAVSGDTWRAGVAAVDITPDGPAWLAGYGSRTEPSEGVLSRLHVKALALEDTDGVRAVIVTSDLIGVTLDFADRVAARVGEKTGLPREALLLNSSHTHCGPESRVFKKDFYDIGDEWISWLYTFNERLEDRFVEAVLAAIDDLAPARLGFTTARPVPFAVSRRLPTPEGIVYRSGPSSYYTGGPRDDIMPVLTVRGTDGSLRAVMFGYACHPITMGGQLVCADYPGYAQTYVEEACPGATAMFVQGCCGELVPNARHQVEYAMGHGRALAKAVTEALDAGCGEVTGGLATAYEVVRIPLEPVPSRGELEEMTRAEKMSMRRKASLHLEMLDRGEPIEDHVPCPFQVFAIGDSLLFAGLCGEPVVDYALSVKKANQGRFAWVAGYCNHEFGYLPTWRILREGGYEAYDAMLNTPFSGPFTGDVEALTLAALERLVREVDGER